MHTRELITNVNTGTYFMLATKGTDLLVLKKWLFLIIILAKLQPGYKGGESTVKEHMGWFE